jgi:hypothetical protein
MNEFCKLESGVQVPRVAPMKITTIDNKVFDTEVLTDEKQMLIEVIEKAKILETVQKVGGYAFVWGSLPKANFSWITQHLPEIDSMKALISSVALLLAKATNNKFKLIVVPSDYDV